MAALWTQEEAINFECARETITHLMAIRTAEIHAAEEAYGEDSTLAQSLRVQRSALSVERKALAVADHANIDRITKEYGLLVRQYNATATLKAA